MERDIVIMNSLMACLLLVQDYLKVAELSPLHLSLTQQLLNSSGIISIRLLENNLTFIS